jgi:hypothetical protein
MSERKPVNADHQRSVVDEWKELNGKIDQLSRFISGESFDKLPRSEQDLLADQLSYMQGYRNCLRKRIARALCAGNHTVPKDGVQDVRDDDSSESGSTPPIRVRRPKPNPSLN